MENNPSKPQTGTKGNHPTFERRTSRKGKWRENEIIETSK